MVRSRRRVLPARVRRIDREARRRINAAPSHPVRDRMLRRLSTAANRGRLWVGVGVVLVLVGHPRAALRGILSLISASIAANLVGKQLFGGRRPLLDGVPLTRRLHRYPTSPSFPSGHSASAAAFATGVAIESPGAGAAIAPLAAAVAYSRLHVGAHWLSDVVGGVALGAAVAGAGALISPPSRRGQGRARPGPPLDLPALADGTGLVIVRNPGAGVSVPRPDPAPFVQRTMPGARLVDLDGGAAATARSQLETPGVRALAIHGGDGTASAIADVCRQSGTPLLVLPGGTFNHFAHAVGVDDVPTGLAAVRAGTGMSVGVATIERDGRATRTMLNTSSIGVYPEFVARRERHEKRWGKWVAGLVAAAGAARMAEPIEVSIDGERMRVWSVFLRVGRIDDGRGESFERRDLTGDVLDVRVLHAPGGRRRAFVALAFGRPTTRLLRRARLVSGDDLQRIVSPSMQLEVHPDAAGATPAFAHDGEVEQAGDGGYTLRYTAHPGALRVYAPR